jgi:hypothetical protein
VRLRGVKGSAPIPPTPPPQDHDIYKQRLAANGAPVAQAERHVLTAPEAKPAPGELPAGGGAAAGAANGTANGTAAAAAGGGKPGCGTCYGAESQEQPCCNTCDDVSGGRGARGAARHALFSAAGRLNSRKGTGSPAAWPHSPCPWPQSPPPPPPRGAAPAPPPAGPARPARRQPAR